LPKDPTGKTLTVGAVLEGRRIFAPEVVLLDAAGKTARTFPAADYYYRGAVFSVQFVPKPDEAFVLVEADPARVGQRYDSIAIGTATTPIVTPYASMNWHSGVDTKESRTFSYEGSAQVTVDDATARKPAS
jgi:hypothetical protein